MFPRQPQQYQRASTSSVQPQPTTEVLAGFGTEIGNGLTPDQQHEAIRRAIEYRLSDKAIAGHASLEFRLGDEAIDPNMWDKIRGGELSEALAQQAVKVERLGALGGNVIDVTENRQRKETEIRQYIQRTGPAIGGMRDELVGRKAA